MNDTEYAEVVAKAEKHTTVCNTPPAVVERPHHDYSPSTLQVLEACPCARSKQSGVPHPRTIIGTLSHEVTDTGEDNPKLGDEDIEKVAECMDFFQERKKYAEAFRDEAVQSGHKDVPQVLELKETYLPVDDLEFDDGGRKVTSTTAGYIDCAIIAHCGTYAEAFDWKFGMWPVEQAENNLQGIAYTLGMFRKFPSLKWVRFWFKQPNIESLTCHLFKREDIEPLYLRVQVVVARAREARKLVAKGDWSMAKPYTPACNFCGLIGKCPRVTEFACRVGSKFFPLEIPASITPTEVHNEADTKLGLQLAAVLSVWASAYKTLVTERVLNRTVPVPDGFVLQSRSNREIVDDKQFKKVALDYLSAEEYEATLSPAFGKTEEKISEKAPRGQKSARVDAFGKALEESGAVKRGEPYTFLRAASKKEKAE